MKRFGQNVSRLRKARNLTQEDMRGKGFNYRYFQKIEAGQVNPTLGTMTKLASAFHCHLRDLVE